MVVRGYLNLSDLRDAIARNRLKMPDLASTYELFRGDRLIRANRRFAESLDGVYHRGEIYLRLLQRLNSVAFGTIIGRFVTRYFALPFGLAFVILEGLQHLLLIGLRLTNVIHFNHLTVVARAVGLGAVAQHTGPRPSSHAVQWWTLLPLAVLMLGLVNAPPLRRVALQALDLSYRAVILLNSALPARLLSRPARPGILSRTGCICYFISSSSSRWPIPAAGRPVALLPGWRSVGRIDRLSRPACLWP